MMWPFRKVITKQVFCFNKTAKHTVGNYYTIEIYDDHVYLYSDYLNGWDLPMDVWLHVFKDTFFTFKGLTDKELFIFKMSGKLPWLK